MADDQFDESEPQARLPGRPQPDRPAPRPQSQPPQPSQAGRTISVDISPRQLRVTPGLSETATVSMRYHGTVITELTLRLAGDVAAWTRIAPDVINVYPDTDAQATLRFDPPRAPSTRAGLSDFSLQVYSSTDPSAATALQRSIEIAPFDELTAEAAGPTTLVDKREAALPIKVRNRGNRPVQVSVRASTIGLVDLLLSTESMYLDPGGEATVWVNVSARRKTGGADAPRSHPFTIVVSSDRSPPITIDGRFEQPEPRAKPGGGNRRLLLGLAGAAMLTGALAVAGVVAGVIKLPGGDTSTTASTSPPPVTNPPITEPGTTTPPPIVTTPPPGVTTPPPEVTTPPPGVTTPPPEVTTPPPVITPSPYVLTGWQKVPGDIQFNQAPAVAGWDPSRIIMLAPDADGALYWTLWDGAQWRAWAQVGGSRKLDNLKPAAVSWGPEHVDVFAILDDTQMYQLIYDNGFWGDWQLVGEGGFTTGPTATTWFAGRLDVFASGTDKRIYHGWYDNVTTGSFWNVWEPVGSPNVERAPGAVAWPSQPFESGHIEVFGLRSLPGEFERLSFPDPFTGTGFSDWYETWSGLSSRNAPSVTSPFEGRIDVFGRSDADDTLYQRILDGGGDVSWHQVSPSRINSAPSAIEWPSGRIDVFALGDDRAVYQKWYDGGIWFP